MLVLSRKQDEVIRIGDDVIVRVLGRRGDNFRIGIEAPTGVPVHRAEVYERIHGKEGGRDGDK